MFQIPIACTQNQTSRVGETGGTRAERAAHSLLPSRCQNTPVLACGGVCEAARSSRAAHSSLSIRAQKKKTQFADTAPTESA